MTVRARRQGANLAPEMASSTKQQADPQLLTKSSWDPGWLSARRVAARDQLPRGDTQDTYLRQCSHFAPRKPSGWDRGGDKTHPSPGADCTHQAPGHISCSNLGRAQNTGPNESVPSWSTQEPESEQLSPGTYMQTRARLRQFQAEKLRAWEV